jgi:tripartite ATP-independent transporter DctP family solute receptor
MSAQLRSGALEFYSAGFLAFASIVPVAGLANIPFAFQDYGQVWAAIDGELGKFIASQISQRGLHFFETVYDNGYRQVTSATRPITTPDDMKGFKIRTPSSPVNIGLFKALGAAVSVMSVNEVYLALQTRIVDGQENPLISVSALKLNEVQKYAAITNHLWDGFPQLANGNVWKSIPVDLQKVIADNINKSGLSQREDAKRLNETLRAELERKGMIFNTTEQQAFKNVLIKSGFYEEWRKKLGEPGWGILQKYSGALG